MSLSVSICIPCYNGASSIDRVLNSIFAQSDFAKDDMEVIVVDDHSPDHSCEVLSRLSQEYPVHLVCNEEQLGLTRNWQKALALGQGDIVTLLHQDDWYASDCLKTVVKFFEEQEDVTLVAFGQIVNSVETSGVHLLPRSEVGMFTGKEYFVRRLLFQDCPAPSSAFMRRQALEQLDVFYDSTFLFSPELDLYIRLALKFPEDKFIHARNLCIHRYAGWKQFSSQHRDYRILDICLIQSRYIDLLGNSAITQASWENAATIIAQDLLYLLRLGKVYQIMEVLRSMCFRNWLSKNQENRFLVVKKMGSLITQKFI